MTTAVTSFTKQSESRAGNGGLLTLRPSQRLAATPLPVVLPSQYTAIL